jgi:hypothetical protein
MKSAVMLALVLVLAGAAHADSLSVTNIAFGTGIENHALTGVDTSFTLGIGKLFCWTLVADAGAGDTIFHTWIIRGYTAQRVPLPVNGYRYRTHSFKTLGEKMTGTWVVQVTDRNGRLLATDSVTIRPN